MGSIIQTNIPQFIEQPGRDIVRSQGKLDRMTVKLLGPYWLADAQRPAKGSPHPDYPNGMFVVTSDTKIVEGALAEITVNYAGRTDTQGRTTFVSESLTSYSPREGELSFNNQPFSYLVNSTTTGSFTPTGGTVETTVNTYDVGIPRMVFHYLTQAVTYRYVATPKPANPVFNGNNASLTWSFTRQAAVSSLQTITGDPTDALFGLQLTGKPFGYQSIVICTAFEANQVIANWYECSETWEIRYLTE